MAGLYPHPLSTRARPPLEVAYEVLEILEIDDLLERAPASRGGELSSRAAG